MSKLSETGKEIQKQLNWYQKILFPISGWIVLLMSTLGIYIVLGLLTVIYGHWMVFLSIAIALIYLEVYKTIIMKKKGYIINGLMFEKKEEKSND